MKILQLCIRFPPAPGGAENHVFHVSKELKDRGHEIKVFTTDLYTEVPFVRMDKPEPNYKGVPVRRFKAHSLGGEMHYVFVPSMLRAILSEKPDLIHTHSYGYFQTNLGALAKKIRDIPFLITPHYHPPWSMWGGAKRKILRKFYDNIFAKSVLNSADVIIGVSSHEMDLLKKTGFRARNIKVIPNGIDFSLFEPIPDGEHFRKRYQITGRMVLYTGRLASNKGLAHLVEAIPKVISRSPDTTFVFVGEDEGEKDKLVKKAKELGIGNLVIFTGHIKDYETFKSSYSACDVFVLPSEYEAFGIVLLEAMACEKPCVGTRVGGVPEVIDENKTGLLVDYGDPNQLADAVIELLEDEERSKSMGKAGRIRVRENFTWPKIVDDLEKVYRSVV